MVYLLLFCYSVVGYFFLSVQKYNLFCSLPNNFLMFFIGVEFSCQNEEVVTEAIDVGDDLGIDFCPFFAEGEDAAFGPSAHGSAYVAYSGGSASAGQDEAAEGGQGGVDAVNLCFDGGHHAGGDDVPWPHVALAVVGGQIATHDEEGVLHLGEALQVVVIGAVGDEESDL